MALVLRSLMIAILIKISRSAYTPIKKPFAANRIDIDEGGIGGVDAGDGDEDEGEDSECRCQKLDVESIPNQPWGSLSLKE